MLHLKIFIRIIIKIKKKIKMDLIKIMGGKKSNKNFGSFFYKICREVNQIKIKIKKRSK